MKKKARRKKKRKSQNSYNVCSQNRVKIIASFLLQLYNWGFCMFAYNACIIINRIKIIVNFWQINAKEIKQAVHI